MAREIETKITQEGRNLMALCLALEEPVRFTAAGIGTGIAPDSDDIGVYTGLLDPYDDAEISGRNYAGNGVMTQAIQYLNSGVTEAADITELILYARDPRDGTDVPFSYTTLGQYPDKLLPGQQSGMLKIWEIPIVFTEGTAVAVQINPSALLKGSDASVTPEPGQIPLVASDGKLHTDITGDAATLGGVHAGGYALSEHTHPAATQSASGAMSAADKSALDTLADRVDQDVRTTAQPTFAGITVNGIITGARFE